MSLLPSSKTPLNQHSLAAIELWLKDLGAERSDGDPCLWNWSILESQAEIKMEKENLRIIWQKNGKKSECIFPYGLSRQDVMSAICEGP